jgi:magnesium transporter
MHRLIALPPGATVTWIDLVDPQPQETQALALGHGLPPAVVRDFLLQPHLPKCEATAEGLLVVLRAFDDQVKGGDTYQALTRRLVVFLSKDRLFTVRRRDQPFAAAVVARYSLADVVPPSAEEVLSRLATGAIRSFEAPLKEAEDDLDRIETHLLAHGHVSDNLRTIYTLKRRCSVIKRILGRSFAVVKELRTHFPDLGGWWADLQEEADRLQAWADELLEAALHLLNVQLGLQSQRTNEVMRLLTVFSACFLPLTFIVGVYGMNFERFPELKWRYGYLYAWGLMATVVAAILVWFRRRGWLR